LSAVQRDIGLVFAGGGNRAFYQLGLMNRWAERLLPQTAAVAACSAGACVALILLAGRQEATHRFWLERRRHVTKNFEWKRMLGGERPTPHAPIYRDTVVHSMQGGGLERLRAQPFPVLVIASRFPRLMPAAGAVALGLGAYSLEKRLHPRQIHPRLPRRLGFSPAVFDARECETPEDVADLVIASSATPPFTPIGRFASQALLDGGLVDNAPAFVAESVSAVRRSIVLLTRPYPPGVAGPRGERLYVAPREPVPVERWDYTRPDLVEATIALGERESALHEPSLAAWLSGREPSADGSSAA
jgi:predicted acylesterase/phospholipase RssA